MSELLRNAEAIWQTACGELQLQMPRETFDTWLRNTRLIAYEDGTFIIGVQHVYAREWLEHRLKKVILPTLSQVAGRSVELRFVIWSGPAEQKDLRSAGPLLAGLESVEEEIPQSEQLAPGETGLNPRYTFDTYAVGNCNRLAHAAALGIVKTPARQFNPLYIHAPVGLGKTHLLHAIGNACAESGYRVLYVPSETLTNDLVAAIRKHGTAEFRKKYRTVDVLLVDDIQFIAGKDSTQEEFYHTFNELYNANAQIIVAANVPPDAIKKLDSRLASRFQGGLLVEISSPDYSMRLDILRIKVRLHNFEDRLSRDILETLAQRSTSSVRELEGALNRVIADAMLAHEAPSAHHIEQILNDMQSKPPSVSLEDIIIAVAEFYNVMPESLCGRDRSREVSTARQVAMYLAREKTNVPLQEIGEVLGGRNHSTVLYSCERVSDLVATDSLAHRQIQQIMQTLLPKTTTAQEVSTD